MERAHDGAVGIVRLDAERAMAYVDGHRVVFFPMSGCRVEREAVQGPDDLPHRFVERDVAGGFPQLLASPEPLLLGGGRRFVAEGGPEKGHQAAHEQLDLRIPGHERLPEPVTPGRAPPPGWYAGFLLQHSRFEETVEVRPHRGRMDSEQAGQFRNLARALAERFDDGQAAGIPQQAVTFRPHPLGKPPVHG